MQCTHQPLLLATMLGYTPTQTANQPITWQQINGWKKTTCWDLKWTAEFGRKRERQEETRGWRCRLTARRSWVRFPGLPVPAGFLMVLSRFSRFCLSVSLQLPPTVGAREASRALSAGRTAVDGWMDGFIYELWVQTVLHPSFRKYEEKV